MSCSLDNHPVKGSCVIVTKLHKSKEKFPAQSIDYQIIDAVNASVYWKDLSGKYLGCNKYMEKMAGMNRNQIVGSTDYNLPWKDQANQIREIDLFVTTNRRRHESEETPVVHGGIKKVFLSSKSPLLDKNDEVIGIIGVSIDITHHKWFEQEFHKVETALDKYSNIKTRFLQNISHESRVPLGSILSISESLKDNWNKFDDKLKRRNLELIFKEANRLSKFILDTFDISHFIKNGVSLNLQYANFSKFLKDMVELYKKKLDNTKAIIIMEHFDDYYLAFDKNLVARTIENLIMNAVQYSPKEKNVVIGLYTTYLKNTEIPAIHCCIKDEGIGIPESELKSVFEPFTESSRTASKACGVGLGLSLCKEMIEAHSGSIWVENNLLKSGTTFNFTIPTNLLSLSNNFSKTQEKIEKNHDNILHGELSKISSNSVKTPFALIGVSPFNSYFSVEKILEICEWINNEYEDFAIFIPDEISRYTFEALGYPEARIGRKTKKQDNYTKNKINTALSHFYKKHPKKNEIKIYTLSELRDNNSYKNLYNIYSDMFHSNKQFRKNCLEVVEWVLSNNNKGIAIDEFQKNIAVQYFLFELPVMTNVIDILKINSCDFVYHNIPKFLKHLYLSKEVISPKQRLLVLK